MPRVTERLRNLERHSVREGACSSASVEKMFRVSSACTAFSLKGNVIQASERVGLLEGTFFMPKMKETHTHDVHLYLRFHIDISDKWHHTVSLINYSLWEFSWICKNQRGRGCHMHACTHVAFLQDLSQHLLPFSGSLWRSPCLTLPTIPLEEKKKGVSGRMCQATAAAPLIQPTSPPPPDLQPLDSPSD